MKTSTLKIALLIVCAAATQGTYFSQVPMAAEKGETAFKQTSSDVVESSSHGKSKAASSTADVDRKDKSPEEIAAAEAQQTSDPDDAQELAKKLSNPIASLISVPFQYNYDHGIGATGEGSRHTINIQPVIPFALSPKWNLISRTILPVTHQSKISSPDGNETGLGDIVQSLFFSPNKTVPFIWGAGPVILIPTATNGNLGSRQLGLGATVVALKQQSGWTYGALANHIWRAAGGSGRPHVNATFLQPFLAYGTKSAWTFSLNTESSYDWTGNSWSVPVHLSVSKLVRLGKQPVSFAGTLRCWATSPANGPVGCGPRLVVTLLYPKR